MDPMAFSPKHKTSRWRPGLGVGGLFVIASLALHWAVLQIPIADDEADLAIQPAEVPDEPIETIDVVRLPLPNPEPQPEPPFSPKPTVEPSPVAQSIAPPTAVAVPQAPQRQANPVPQPAPETALAPELTLEPAANPASEPSPEPSPLTLDERLQTFAAYQPNNRTKSLATNTNEFLAWYSSQSWDGLDVQPLPGAKDLSALVIEYPLTQCLTPAPTEGQLEVIINPDGALIQEPRVLGSTGYDVLDEKAVEVAAQYEFPPNEGLDEPAPTVYWLPVEIDYDAATCTP